MWKLTSSIQKKAYLCLPSTSEMRTVMARLGQPQCGRL